MPAPMGSRPLPVFRPARLRSQSVAMLAAAGIAFTVAGCSTPRSYLDPSSSEMSYDQLRRPEAPQRLNLTTVFQRNGQAYVDGDPPLRVNTERVLRRSGLIEPATTRNEGEISVIVNNVSQASPLGRDVSGGRLGLGLIGNAGADHYVMSVTIRSGLAGEASATDRPRYFSASNSAEAPTGLDLMASDRSFGKVVEQLLLGILKEYQAR